MSSIRSVSGFLLIKASLRTLGRTAGEVMCFSVHPRRRQVTSLHLIPGELNFKHCVSVLSVFPAVKLRSFPLWLISMLWGDILRLWRYAVWPSHFLSHWSQRPLMILTQINYYDGCQVIIFHLHPFFDIQLLMVYLFFLKKLPLSLTFNKITCFICIYIKPQVLISPNGIWSSFIVMFKSLQIWPVGVQLATVLSRFFEMSLYFLEHFHSFRLNLLFSPMSSYTWCCGSFSYIPCVGMNWVGLGRQYWVFLVCE